MRERFFYLFASLFIIIAYSLRELGKTINDPKRYYEMFLILHADNIIYYRLQEALEMLKDPEIAKEVSIFAASNYFAVV